MISKQPTKYHKQKQYLLLERESSIHANHSSMLINAADYTQCLTKPKQPLQIHKSFVVNGNNEFMIGSENQYLCSLFRNAAIKSIAKPHISQIRKNSTKSQLNTTSPIIAVHKADTSQKFNLTIEGKGKCKPIIKPHSSVAIRHIKVRKPAMQIEKNGLLSSLLINESHNECRPNISRNRNFTLSTIKILSLLNKKMSMELMKSQFHKSQKIEEIQNDADYSQIKLHLLGKQYLNKFARSKFNKI